MLVYKAIMLKAGSAGTGRQGPNPDAAQAAVGALAGTSDSVSSLSVEDLYARYFPPLREKCRRMLGDGEDAADVAQETFIRFWKHRAEVLESRAAIAWLYRSSTRLAIDRIRQRKVRASVVAEGALEVNLESLTFDPEAQADARRTLTALARGLDPDEMELAILVLLDGLTQGEVMEVLGVTDRTVRRRLRRLEEKLQKLRRELSQ